MVKVYVKCVPEVESFRRAGIQFGKEVIEVDVTEAQKSIIFAEKMLICSEEKQEVAKAKKPIQEAEKAVKEAPKQKSKEAVLNGLSTEMLVSVANQKDIETNGISREDLIAKLKEA